MARRKSVPIDVSKLKSINGVKTSSFENSSSHNINIKEGPVVEIREEPSLIAFKNDEMINTLHPLHSKSECLDCIDFKTTWISQILIQEEWVTSKVRPEPKRRMRRYMEPSDAIKPRRERITNEAASYPKELEFPPVDNTINRFASRLRGRAVNGHISLLQHWEEDSYENSEQRGRSPPADDTINRLGCQVRAGEVNGAMSLLENWKEDSYDTNHQRGKSRSEATEDTMSDATMTFGVEERHSSEETNYVLPLSERQPAPAPPTRPTSMTTASVRACINCYERHHGCDRGLPACSGCAASNANCVYPDPAARVCPKKRNKW